MTYILGQAPELALAFPFVNMSFGKWTGTLPDSWLENSPAHGTKEKYRPGFDLTQGVKIYESGVVADLNNRIYQAITLPGNVPNAQKIRAGFAYIDSFAGRGETAAVLLISQNGTSYQLIHSIATPHPSAVWRLFSAESTSVNISTAYTDLAYSIRAQSGGGTSDPAVAYDCLFAEYGLSAAEAYYTFTHSPAVSGIDIRPMLFGKSERTGSASLRRFDTTGGAVKWKITFPFQNVPASFVETMAKFWEWNKGLGAYEPVPLVLHHYLLNPAASHTAGDDYLRRPPWLICNIMDEEFPFSHAGSFLGAELYNGTLNFEEI